MKYTKKTKTRNTVEKTCEQHHVRNTSQDKQLTHTIQIQNKNESGEEQIDPTTHTRHR